MKTLLKIALTIILLTSFFPCFAAQDANAPILNIEKIYLKSITANGPTDPSAFLKKDPAREAEKDVKVSYTNLGADYYEVVLTLKLKMARGKDTAFSIEAKQAGIFLIKNSKKDVVQYALNVTCANIIFPFLRESVADASARMGSSPVIFSPINFEAIYENSLSVEPPKKYIMY